MRYGSTAEYTVNGVTFVCKQAAGPRWAYQEAMAEMADEIDVKALQSGDASSISISKAVAMNRAMAEFANACIVGVRGIEDAAGKPVDWAPEVLMELDEPTIGELVRRLNTYEHDQAGDAGNAAKPSPESPGRTTEGTE